MRGLARVRVRVRVRVIALTLPLTLPLSLTLARPRIYSDLRAAASLGGYHFNWSRLEGHLEISDEVVPHDRPCEAAPAGSRAGSVHETSPNSGYFLERIAASSPS